jgi:hypothetical protein
MRNTADVTGGGKTNAVWSQSISDVSAVNPLVAFRAFLVSCGFAHACGFACVALAKHNFIIMSIHCKA